MADINASIGITGDDSGIKALIKSIAKLTTAVNTLGTGMQDTFERIDAAMAKMGAKSAPAAKQVTDSLKSTEKQAKETAKAVAAVSDPTRGANKKRVTTGVIDSSTMQEPVRPPAQRSAGRRASSSGLDAKELAKDVAAYRIAQENYKKAIEADKKIAQESNAIAKILAKGTSGSSDRRDAILSNQALAATGIQKLLKSTMALGTAKDKLDAAYNKATRDGKVPIKFTVDSGQEYIKQKAAIDAAAAAQNKNAESTKKASDATKKQNQEVDKSLSNLPRLRYALYDVSAGMNNVGTAGIKAFTNMFNVASQYEKNFTDVLRTTQIGVGTGAANDLKASLMGIVTTTPIDWQQITQIGTLAGQLGIAKTSIAEFTDITAKLSATTGMNVDFTATALGRLGQIIPGVNGQYERLASTILAVGVSSVATEKQIINIATQLSGVASYANMTAAEVIGLSGAFASMGAAPELARSTTLRTFMQINSAVTSGGKALGDFGAIAGMSGGQFADAWSQSNTSAFVMFLKGLNENSADAAVSLQTLGITSVRDIPLLQKLSSNWKEVARQVSIAQGAFIDNNAVQQQYSVFASTTAAKVDVLKNNFEAFTATLGSSSLSAAGGVLDALIGTLQALSTVLANPVANGLVTVLLGVGLFIAVAAKLGAVILRVAGNIAGFKTMLIESKAAMGASTVMTEADTMAKEKNAAAAAKAATATKAMLLGMGALLGVALLIGGAVWAISAANDAFASSADKAKKAFGDLTPFIEAIKADTAAATQANGEIVTSYDTMQVKVGSVVDTHREARVAIGDTAAGEQTLNEQLGITNEELENQTYVLGEAYDAAVKKAVADKLLADDGQYLVNMFTRLSDVQKEWLSIAAADNGLTFDTTGITSYSDVVTKLGFSMATLSSEYQKGGAEGQAYFDKIMAAAQESGLKGTTFGTEFTMAMKRANEELNGVWGTAQGIPDALAAVMAGMDAAGVSAENFADKIQLIKDTVTGMENKLIAQENALYGLGQAMADSGMQIGYGSQEAIAALSGLTGTIDAILAASSSGPEAAANMQVLLDYLVNNLGVPISMLGVLSSAITQALAGQKMGTATMNVDALTRGLQKTSKAASGAAKKIYLLTDYANDLANIFTRAFDIRFSGSQTLDKITSAFSDIAQNTADARAEIDDINQSINELNADILGLTADKALQEYFLTVAEAYGDTLKAQEIRAELAKIDADLAGKNSDLVQQNKDLTKAQAKTNKTLIGNSDAAIENRSEILDLVSSYQDHIKALAASGMKQDELRATTDRLKQDFMAQATQLGYNSDELGVYAVAFDDVKRAIDAVPRNIDVEFKGDPALAAIEEFAAKAKAAISSVSNTPINLEVESGDALAKIGEMTRAQLLSQYAIYVAEVKQAKDPTRKQQLWDAIYWINSRLGREYSSGGYTGAGGKYDVAGIVHKGEYVVPKEQVNQTTGLPFYMSQMPKFFSGGSTTGNGGGGMVSLSPEDRALLRNVGGSGNIVLYADSKELARSVNDGNRQIVASGGRP